jgi:hypothetical protein
MLWLEVDRRVARRKRFQVTAWSLAGATAALAAVLAVPAIVGLIQGDPRDIDILPLDQTPVAGVVPELYVTDVDNWLQVRALASGDLVSPALTDDDGRWGEPVDELAVRPGSTRENGAVAAIRGTEAGVPMIEVATTGVGPDGELWLESTGHALGDEGELTRFRPSVVWTPDQHEVAFTMPVEDQSKLVLWEPGATVGQLAASEMVTSEPSVVFGIGDVELLDWVGQTADTGDVSVLFYRDELGVHAIELTVAEDGSMTTDESEVLDGVYDVAASHAQPGDIDPPVYRLVEGSTGAALVWLDPDAGRPAEIDLTEHLGDVHPETLWLDAKQDAALVGDGNRTLLFAHDGTGNFVEPVEVGFGGLVALYDAPRPGSRTPTPEPSVEDPSEEPAPEPTQTQEPSSAVGATLPEPVVTATIRDLVLHGPDGQKVIYTLPAEGESSFLSVAVRPGSTVDDLTLVALHRAEGMQDFRTVHYVDGELATVEYWTRPEFQPGFGGALGGGVAAFGPVWHPAGDKLAWIEMGTSGVPNLRIIGWTDDGPGTGNTADDNTSFTLDEFEGIVVEPLEWVDLGGGQTEIRGVAEDFFTQWIAIPIEIQADNAAAMSSPARAETMTGDGRVGGVAGMMADGTPRWMLRDRVVVLDPTGEGRTVASVPEEFFPGEGLPDTWMREIGDGVLVGMSNTGLAYYVTADGELARVGEDAWMHGDVVD